MRRIRLLCLAPDLGGGGAEHVMTHLLRGLDRSEFAITLGLAHASGTFMRLVPGDVEIVNFGQPSALRSVPALVKLLRSHRFDVCYSMLSMNLAVVVARMLAQSQTSLVLGARNHYTLSMTSEASARALKMRAVRFLYPRADRVICVSQGVADDLVKNFRVPVARTAVVHNPVEIATVRALASSDPRHPWLNAQEHTAVIIAVGKLRLAKGYPDLLRAVRLLSNTVAVRLLILGEGPERTNIVRLIADLGLQHQVELLGFQENPYQYVARSTVFCHAAHWEGFPNVLPEAMACGTPVVSTDCPSGPSEIIHDGLDGLLVPVGRPSALANALLRVLQDPSFATKLASQASARVERFGVSRVVDTYAHLLRDVTSRRLKIRQP